MKKHSWLMIVIMIFTLFGCGKKADPIMLPEADEIASIEIPGGIEDVIVTDKETIAAFVEKVKEAKPTSNVSVQDVPAVSEYTRVDFVGAGIFTSIFIYEENGKWYIEQPYHGIYETDETLLHMLK